MEGVRAVTPRLAFQALLSTGEDSASVEVAMVDPVTDTQVFPRLKVIEGSWLTDRTVFCSPRPTPGS